MHLLTLLVAFVLPLPALAIPTSVSVKSTAELDNARDQFLQGLLETSSALNANINYAKAITFPPQQDVIDCAIKAYASLRLAGDALMRVGAALEDHKMPAESDQFETAKNTLDAQTIIMSLEEKIKGDGWHRKRDGKSDNYSHDLAVQLGQLRMSICNTLFHIDMSIKVGLQFLALQGKSVKDLFEHAGVPVPAGF